MDLANIWGENLLRVVQAAQAKAQVALSMQ
jgi:hypothetical protein